MTSGGSVTGGGWVASGGPVADGGWVTSGGPVTSAAAVPRGQPVTSGGAEEGRGGQPGLIELVLVDDHAGVI